MICIDNLGGRGRQKFNVAMAVVLAPLALIDGMKPSPEVDLTLFLDLEKK